VSYEANLVAEHAWLAELRNASTAGTETVTCLVRIVPGDSLVPGLGRAPAAEAQQASLADFRMAEAASYPEFDISIATGAQGGTYWDRIVPDNTLVPSLGGAPVVEEYFEMPWRTPVTDTRAHQPQ
jgi:hypothetical protein